MKALTAPRLMFSAPMRRAFYDYIDECGSVKAAKMVQTMYDDGLITHGAAHYLLIVCVSNYNGENFAQFDLK